MRALRVTSAIIALTFAGACGKSEDQPRDITLQPVAGSDSQAVLRDSAPTTANTNNATKPAETKTEAKAPATKAATPPAAKAPAAPSARYGVLASGTEIGVRTGVKACTNTHKVGDRITGTVAEAVTGTNGATIPAGATATIEVTQSTYGKNDANAIKFAFKVVSLEFGGQTYELASADVVAPPITKVRRQSTTEQAKKVGAGAAIGAIVGQVAGKDTKSTVIGAAVGAVGGAAVAAGTADYDGCVAPDARLAATLGSELRVKVS
ncbi:MAG TPA: hypothetical protein VJR92_10645 [Gemmatimonadaceae bacterium]|nr:hypothetical protein [Gemmatimonadaceae bacterium]